MNKPKRIIALLLVIALVLPVLPITIFADTTPAPPTVIAEGAFADGLGGERGAVWHLGSDGVLHIQPYDDGSGDPGYIYWNDIVNPWDSYVDVDNDPITPMIERISITGNIIAGQSLQSFFRGLPEIMFISGLDNLDISGTTDISYIFADTPSLVMLSLLDFDIPAAINITNMFQGTGATFISLDNYMELDSSVSLPEPPTTGNFTGYWVNSVAKTGSDPWLFLTSAELMDFAIGFSSNGWSWHRLLSLSPYSPPSGQVGQAYSFYFEASSSHLITWTYSGDLPTGLTLTNYGRLHGTPTDDGTFTFTVTASNGGVDPDVTSTSISITIAEAPPPPPQFMLTVANSPAGTVSGQTASGNRAAGSNVSIDAGAKAGYTFSHWSAPAGTFANANSAVTTFTMPSEAVTITANWTPQTVPPNHHMMQLTNSPAGIAFGQTGSGNREAGSAVSISAGIRLGYVFSHWTHNAEGQMTFANANSSITSFTMPSQAVTLTAHWTPLIAPNQFLLQFVNDPAILPAGQTASGNRTAGSIITINAGILPGFVFSHWTYNAALGQVIFADPFNPVTTFVMPANVTVITAHWLHAGTAGQFSVTVEGSSLQPAWAGSGHFYPGQIVTVHTGNRPDATFTGWWSFSPATLQFLTPITSTSVSFIMPATNVVIRAMWSDGWLGWTPSLPWQTWLPNMPPIILPTPPPPAPLPRRVAPLVPTQNPPSGTVLPVSAN